MVGFRPGMARCRRWPGRVSGLVMAIGLLAAACGPAHTAATGTATAHGTARPSSSASPPPGSTADCASAATCYTPQQLEVAYGVQPLLRRGIDGRGETVVLPELAETQPNPLVVTDLRQDFAAYDRLYHLPAPRSMRGIPDVAADGDPVTGIAVITSNADEGYTISGHAGTSASAPLWAGIIALADQDAHRHLGFVNPAMYQIARSSQYHQAFHDVTAGNSNMAEFPPTTITGYRAGPGWDPVTGWGSPDAQVLVPLLARLG
jgi:subtilase family serine protease